MTSTELTATASSSRAAEGPPEARRRQWWLVPAVLVGLVLLVVTTLLVAVRVGGSQPDFDTDAEGYSAIRALLEDEGVTVDSTTRMAETLEQVGPNTTVVVPRGASSTDGQLERLLAAGAGRVVLVDARSTYLEQQAVPAETTRVPGGVYPATCPDPAAGRAGTVSVDQGGTVITANTATLACYPVEDGHLYAVVPMGAREVHLLNVPFDNRTLAREGNASLAMQVLGQHEQLVWYTAQYEPGESTRGDDGEDTPTLLGPNWLHAVALALVALVVCATWRGRRLGPIITERLPVVVPASETVEGHGRLYARIGARQHAAEQLRAATRRRLSRILGHHDDPETLARAIADRTGHPYAHVRQRLDGPPPPTDDDLVTLKRQLDALEQEARQP